MSARPSPTGGPKLSSDSDASYGEIRNFRDGVKYQYRNHSLEDTMYRQYVPESGYQDRRDYRTAMEEWLATIDADLSVTLGLSQDARLGSARQLLRQWFARLDNHYLGRGWARRNSDDRTFAMVIPENISTNLHYHCLMRLPSWGRTQSIADCQTTLDGFWQRLVRHGNCEVRPIYEQGGSRATS